MYVNNEISLEFCDVVDRLNHDALDVIRKTGGNNDKRVVILTPPGSDAAALPYMNPPDDQYIMYGVFGDPWNVRGHRQQYIFEMLKNDVAMMFIELSIDPKYLELYSFEDLVIGDYAEALSINLSRYTNMGIPAFYWNCSPPIFGDPWHPDTLWFFNMTTGEWNNEDLLEIFLTLCNQAASSDETEIITRELPYERIESEQNDDEWIFRIYPTDSSRRDVERVVVEHSGYVKEHYWFCHNTQDYVWTNIWNVDRRISHYDGRIILDTRYLSKTTYFFEFRIVDLEDVQKITRIYLDGSAE